MGRLRLPSQGNGGGRGQLPLEKQAVTSLRNRKSVRLSRSWKPDTSSMRKAQGLTEALLVTLPYTCPASHKWRPPEQTHPAFTGAKGRPKPDTRISWACTVCRTLLGAFTTVSLLSFPRGEGSAILSVSCTRKTKVQRDWGSLPGSPSEQPR